jgi:RNA polymerase sigma-70 factor (ECF subfamily)
MRTSFPGVRPLHEKPKSATAPADALDALLAAGGDVGAFERLYRGHAARIHGLACRMVNPAEAVELTQDVFVRAWSKLGTFRGEAAFGTWLYRLAVNVILARRARLRLEQGRFDAAEDALDALPARGGGQLDTDFESAIRRLPDGARQIFVLHDVEGYKHEEIASMLGLTAGTSKAQRHRARMALRKRLAR